MALEGLRSFHSAVAASLSPCRFAPGVRPAWWAWWALQGKEVAEEQEERVDWYENVQGSASGPELVPP